MQFTERERIYVQSMLHYVGYSDRPHLDVNSDSNVPPLSEREHAALLEKLARPAAEIEAVCKRVFLDGHSEGWRGNQLRRDVQHVDAEKGWNLYVANGALGKTLAMGKVEANEPARIAVVLNGGSVEDIFSTAPVEAVVIELEPEGADPDQLFWYSVHFGQEKRLATIAERQVDEDRYLVNGFRATMAEIQKAQSRNEQFAKIETATDCLACHQPLSECRCEERFGCKPLTEI